MKLTSFLKSKIFFWLIVALLAACGSTKQLSRKNLLYMYQPEDQFTELRCIIFHSNDSLSNAFLPVRLSDLLYRKHDFLNYYIAEYSISVKLLDAYEAKDPIYQNTFIYRDSLNFGKSTQILHLLDIPAKMPGKYLLEIRLWDQNRISDVKAFFEVDKQSLNVAQNFLLVDKNNSPLLRNYLEEDETFRIRLNRGGIDKLKVNAYFRDFPISSPPFVANKRKTFDYEPDSVFYVAIIDRETGLLELPREGFYQFQTDPKTREGLSLFRFYPDFPDLNDATLLLPPLRYITTQKEYDKIAAKPDTKSAIDDFWLETAGNHLRAKSLIQSYYGNVTDANIFFTSYHEGWKTDRGLIFTILGMPNAVYRGYDQEEWVYGEPENRNSLRLTFVKVINPFTDNDYMLLTSPTYKEAWYNSVDNWRR